MGYYMDQGSKMRQFFKHNLFRVVLRMAFLLLTGNQLAWKKVVGKRTLPFEIVNFSCEHIPANQRGDLLSICVLPEMRGKGVAQELITAYLDCLRQHGRKLCLLTVSQSNGRGIRFYERNGFIPYKHMGSIATTYMKRL